MTDTPTPPESLRKLSHKQRVFIDEYLKCWNATEAARRAGYSEKTARQIGQQNLSKLDIKAEIDARLTEIHMSADEALDLLAQHARGDVAEFMDLSAVGWNISLMDKDPLTGEIVKKPNTRLIKKLKQKVTTINEKGGDEREIIETEIELYDAQAALDKVLRVAGKYKDPGTPENPFTLNAVVYIPDNKRDKDA